MSPDSMRMGTGRDFRKLDAATQAELRRVAVTMVVAGKACIEAAAAVGVNRRFMGEWVGAVARSGEATLSGGRRGRSGGAEGTIAARGRQDQATDHRARAALPWVRMRCAQRIAELTLTPSTPAAPRADKPPATAPATRSRRSFA